MRGIFYSVITLLLLTPIILLTVTYIHGDEAQDQSTVTTIIGNKLVAYSRSIEQDLPRALQIMGKHAIVAAVTYVEENGTALSDAGVLLTELAANGTLLGNDSTTNFTLTSWTAILQQKGEQYGFNTSVTFQNVSFSSNDSYTVSVNAAISVNATNQAANMEFYRVYTVTTAFSIQGIDDPLYVLYTNGILRRSIVAPNETVQGVAGFDKAIQIQAYMPSSEGAGILDRLEGRLRNSGKYNESSAAIGLESIIMIPVFQSNNIPIKGNSTDIDYLYFDPGTYSGYAVNQSFYGWLRIDSSHATAYNLTIG